MNTSTTQIAVASPVCCDKPSKKALAKIKARQLAERGMATSEYAVGIMAAVALALVLMKVFNADSFLTIAMKLVATIFTKVLGWL